MLTDDDFTYAGVNYAVNEVVTSGTQLQLSLDKAIPADIRSTGTLYVDGSPFRFADATFNSSNGTTTWTNTGLSWSVGDTVQLRLTEQPELQPCEMLPAGHQIVLSGSLDSADGTICSNIKHYQLAVYMRDENDDPATHTSDVCVLLERISGSEIIANYIGLPRESYIKAGTTDFTMVMNVHTEDLSHIRDLGPVVIGARTGEQLSTFTLTVVDGSSNSCLAPSPTTTGTTRSTPSTSSSSSSSTTSTPSGGIPFFAPPIRDTTPPTIISMNITGNATRTLGEDGPLLFNITFSEPVSGVDPSDFVLMAGNDTVPVPANLSSFNATIHPEQVIPHNNTSKFVIEIEPGAAYDGTTISGGTARFDIEYMKSPFLEVHLTAPDCRTILLHNQTFPLPSDMVKPRTIEPLAGSPLAGPWTLGVQNHARTHNATVHMYGLTLDVGQAITINGTGSNYLVAVNAATTGNLTLGLADDQDIADASGNRLAGGVPAGVHNTYILAEPPRRTCP